MRLVRSVVCMCALALALPAWGEGEEGSAAEVRSKIEELLNQKVVERLKRFLNQGLLQSEQLQQLVDKDYWNSIKDDFSARVSTIIEEDEFIQAVLPIIDSVRLELSELLKLAIDELLTRGEQIATKIREIIEDLRQKAVVIVEQALAKIKEIAEMKPEEYKALISKVGSAVGQQAQNIVEETTLVVASVLLAATDQLPAVQNP